MDPPLRFVIRPGALTVRLPRAALSRPTAPPAVHVSSAPTLAALWRTALGRPARAHEHAAYPCDPVEERLARRLDAALAGERTPSSTGRPGCSHALGRLDLAAYTAVARMSTPVLDVPLRRLSHFANFSKPWFLTAAALALLGGPTGRRAAVTGVAAIGAASLLVNQPMKMLGRPPASRPRRRTTSPRNAGSPMPTSTSFPSGHSASAARLRRRRLGRRPGPARAARRGRRNRRVLAGVHRRPLPRRRHRRRGDGGPAGQARLAPGWAARPPLTATSGSAPVAPADVTARHIEAALRDLSDPPDPSHTEGVRGQ